MEIQEQKIEQFKGRTRLPEFAVPKRYDLAIKLDLSASTFSGFVAIDVSINGPTKFLVLNALELVVHGVSFTTSHKQVFASCSSCFFWNSYFYGLLCFFLSMMMNSCSCLCILLQKHVPSVDSDDEILVLEFEEVLELGFGLLEIEFSGALNEHLKGLYRW